MAKLGTFSCLFFGLGVALAPRLAWAGSTEISPGANLGQEIAKLTAGDELVLTGGTYTLNSKLTITVGGSAAMPITIRAKDGETPVITRDASQNTINVDNTQYVILKGLEIDGGSHGIRITNSSFITVEDCEIHNTADVGVSTNVPGSKYEGITIRHNEIHHTGGTGEGMYLGCNNNGCQMFDSLIEQNHVHHTNQGVSQGDGIELKQGSYNNIIRDNVIHDTNYPCLIIYGTAGNPVNLIERNALWNCGDMGIQAEADAIIRNNLILGAGGDGIHDQNHQQNDVKDLTIVHNTVINTGTAIRTDNIDKNVIIANNAIYSQNGNALRASGNLANLTVAGNVGMGSLQGVSSGVDTSGNIGSDFVAASFGGAPMNVFPKAGGKLIGAGDAQYVPADDFNGTQRGGVADVGAYKYDASGNPGWTLAAGFKDAVAGGGTGGTGGSGGSGVGGASSGGASSGGAAGTPSGGGAGASSGGTSSGGSAGAPAGGSGNSSSDDGGCGCRTARSSSGFGFFAALLALGLLFSRRERR